MQKTEVNNNTALAIFFVATAVVMIAGAIVLPVLQEAEARSGNNAQVCDKLGRFNACIATEANPSNPNSICDNGREFGGNRSGSNC